VHFIFQEFTYVSTLAFRRAVILDTNAKFQVYKRSASFFNLLLKLFNKINQEMVLEQVALSSAGELVSPSIFPSHTAASHPHPYVSPL